MKPNLIEKTFGLPDEPAPRQRSVTSERLSQVIRERDALPRVSIEQPIVAYPVFPDGNPYFGQHASGISVDLSHQDIGLEIETREWYPAKMLIVGVTHPDGRRCFAGVEVQGAVKVGQNRIGVGGRFGGMAHDMLDPDRLTPRFRPDTMEFTLGFPQKVLDRWAEMGVLRCYVHDRVMLCPRCLGLPTFRKGCRSCGSARTANDRLIHHFACAHVGAVAEFEVNGRLVCPKCRTRDLVVGADYEYALGPHHCQDCHWNDMSLEEVGQCLRCGFRFPGHQALQQELKGYHVDRLDPLALLPAS